MMGKRNRRKPGAPAGAEENRAGPLVPNLPDAPIPVRQADKPPKQSNRRAWQQLEARAAAQESGS